MFEKRTGWGEKGAEGESSSLQQVFDAAAQASKALARLQDCNDRLRQSAGDNDAASAAALATLGEVVTNLCQRVVDYTREEAAKTAALEKRLAKLETSGKTDAQP